MIAHKPEPRPDEIEKTTIFDKVTPAAEPAGRAAGEVRSGTVSRLAELG